MNLKELKEIVAIFEKADISELDLEREGMRVKLKKGLPPEFALLPRAVEAGAAGEVSQVAQFPSQKLAQAGQTEISSPIVGTFYRAPAPTAKPFVKEGDEIEEGQVLCLIEAMKLMNEIKSEVKGRIEKILVENGHAVEFGQSLFIIKPL